MYVRDHTRPAFHAALGLDPTEYDYQVFRVCSEITRQVFPLMLDTENPRFRATMERLRRLSDALIAAKAAGGVLAPFRKAGLAAAIGLSFCRLYLLRTQPNVAPRAVRLAPAW
jgi:magnesium-protoporphyrin IX monomethyl ester (oxidative) cyclase